jgi:hypothetical protein
MRHITSAPQAETPADVPYEAVQYRFASIRPGGQITEGVLMRIRAAMRGAGFENGAMAKLRIRYQKPGNEGKTAEVDLLDEGPDTAFTAVATSDYPITVLLARMEADQRKNALQILRSLQIFEQGSLENL